MENLSVMWESFSNGKYLLAATFFTGRVLSMEAIARTFKLLWHIKKGFEVPDMGDHRVLFVFTEDSDVDNVLVGEPWSFNKNLVVLKRVRSHTEVKSLVFDRACFWLQVHDLPLGILKTRVAKEIVSAAGEVVQSKENSDEYEGSNFVHVRVSIDIKKPLSRGRKIGKSNGEESWASFKYERFPNLCYWCGCLTHQDRDCSLWQRRKGTLREGNQKFGSWLHAATPNIAKKTIVRVAGYEEEVNGELACNPSPGSNGEGEWFKPQPEVGGEGDEEQRFPVAMGDHVVQETTSSSELIRKRVQLACAQRAVQM